MSVGLVILFVLVVVGMAALTVGYVVFIVRIVSDSTRLRDKAEEHRRAIRRMGGTPSR